MDNQGSFKSKGNTLFDEYTSGVKVFLESPDDEYIIGRKWFSHLKDRISFQSVSETKADGGCRMVLKKVKESNNNGDKAFGIVDRDILLADPNYGDSLWWELDDEIFINAKPYGDFIFVLHKWEMESYLLHPDALKSLVSDKKLAAISAETIAKKLVEEEADFIAVTMLSTINAKTQTGEVSENYGRGDSGEQLKQKVKQQLSISDLEYDAEYEKIMTFAENNSDAITRWNKLSRLLDGKRAIGRINNFLSQPDMVGCRVDLFSERGALAIYTANQGLIDSGLTTWLKDIHHSVVS